MRKLQSLSVHIEGEVALDQMRWTRVTGAQEFEDFFQELPR